MDWRRLRGWDIAVPLAASVFIAFGLWLGGIGVHNVWRAFASESWPKVQGVVAQSDTGSHTTRDRRANNSSTTYSAHIAIKYQVGGLDFTTETLHFGQTLGTGDSSDAELRHLQFPENAEVTVSYDPGEPAIAAVKPGFDPEVLWLPFAGLAFAFPGAMFIALYFGIREGSRGTGIGLGMFATIFASIGVALLLNGGVNLWRAHASQSWPTVPGQVVYGALDASSSVTRDSDGDASRTTAYGAHLVYQYEVNGTRHFSNVRWFGQLAGSSAEWAAEIAERYPKGREVRVAHSPRNPDLAVLEPGIANEAFWLPGAGAAFFLFGLAVFVWGIPALTVR